MNLMNSKYMNNNSKESNSGLKTANLMNNKYRNKNSKQSNSGLQ